MKFILPLLVILITTSCFKTAQEIERDKRVDQLLIQKEQSGKLVANLTQQVQELEGRLASTSGQIQEMDHLQKTSQEKTFLTTKENLAKLNAQVSLLTKSNEKQANDLNNLKIKVNSQSTYIKKVNTSLGTIVNTGSKSKSGSKLQEANKLFEKSKLTAAFDKYNEVLSESKINAAQKNAVYYNLGLISYWKKEFEDCISYMSKIYTKYPRSSYAPKSLLYIARAFKKMNKKDEANATFDAVIKKYPKTKHARNAKKEKA
jgi:TolA-binding protein